MVTYDKLKDFGKVVENSYGPVIFNRENVFFFKTATIAVCFHKLGKVL
jgi:hypothetical protein